ncbi:MAG: glycosyltransferase family 4 protein [Anaeromyxobacter sp.]
MRVAIAIRNLSRHTGASGTVLKHTALLAGLGHAVEVFGLTVRRELVEAAGGLVVSLRRPWGSSRAAYARRFERVRRRGAHGLVLGHGDVERQDVLFLHNLVRRAHRETHGAPPPAGSDLAEVAANHARILAGGGYRVLVANSRLMADELVAMGVPAAKVEVVWPTCDPARFHPVDGERRAALRARWGVPPEAFLVGLVTSGDFTKRGVDLLLEAAAALPPAVARRAWYLVVGRSKDFAARVARLPAPLRARLVQAPPVDEVEEVHQALDVLVHPARFEEFGQVVAEAMACGVPVITSRRVGASELLPHSPLLLEEPTVEGLVDRLVRVHDAPALAAEVGAASRSAALAHGLPVRVARTLELLHACGLPRPAGP